MPWKIFFFKSEWHRPKESIIFERLRMKFFRKYICLYFSDSNGVPAVGAAADASHRQDRADVQHTVG